MGETSIEWTDHSVNPIRFGPGHYCQKVSPGCANCYASRLQSRFGTPEFGGTGGKVPPVLTNGVTDGQMIWFDQAKLAEVVRRKKPTRYFWCDMTDLFGVWVPDEWIDRCFATMILTGQHTHQVLTKRPERMAEYLRRIDGLNSLEAVAADPLVKATMALSRSLGHPFWPNAKLEFMEGQWPQKHIWLGTSVEDRQRKARIDQLRGVPAAVRFLSLEPLLEDLGTLDLTGIHWVIVGGESGPGARPMRLDWARSLVEQCRAAGIACFMKQLGSAPTTEYTEATGAVLRPQFQPEQLSLKLADRKGGDINEFPSDLRVRQFPTTKEQP